MYSSPLSKEFLIKGQLNFYVSELFPSFLHNTTLFKQTTKTKHGLILNTKLENWKLMTYFENRIALSMSTSSIPKYSIIILEFQ